MVPVEAVLLLLAQAVRPLAVEVRQQEEVLAVQQPAEVEAVLLLLAEVARQQVEVVEEAELNQPHSFVTGNHPSHHPLHTA